MVNPYRPGDQMTVGKVVFEISGVGMEILVIRPVQLVHSDGEGMTLKELYGLREQFQQCQKFVDVLAPLIAKYEATL